MSNILGNMPPVFGSGYRGVVPAPSAADVSAQNILRADGTWGATPGGAIPSQTGNAGKVLTTDGTNATWSSSLAGDLTVNGTTDSSSKDTGAIVTEGGLGVEKSASIGGNLTVNGGKVLISYPSSSQARVSFGGAHFDANSSYASYIRGYSSSATTAGLDFYTTYGSSVLALSLSEQGNATLAGNLTVSGGTISSGTASLTLKSTASTVLLQSAGTTALTLDSSQNATFAGTATFGKGGGNTTFSANGTTAESGIFTQANTGFVFFSDNATATKGIKVDVNNGGLTVLSGGLTTATAGGSAGTWKLGVYSATAPSATGFVTIDIGGTTYKLLAST